MQVRDHDHSSIASRGPHKVKPRSGLSAAICLTSCTALVHGTALGARTAWGPHLLTPPACVVPQGLPRGAARTDRLLAHHGAARLCLSLPAFLAPLAPPHTRRFLGDSLDARLLSRCAPASLQMRANAVFAPILRLAWLLILNMVPGARGLALASMVPRSRRTYIGFHQQPCRPVSHRSLHPPRPPPL